MSDAGNRNPITNPAWLDQVKSQKGVTRTIEYVTTKNHIIYSEDRRKGEHVCGVKSWRKWAKGGKIVRRGREPVVWLLENVRILEPFGREINVLRNRLGRFVPSKSGMTLANETEIVVSLAELAVGDFRCRSLGSQKEFKDRLARNHAVIEKCREVD